MLRMDESKEKSANSKDIIDLLKRNVKKLLPRKIVFVEAKTEAGSHPKSVNKQMYTRKDESESQQSSKKKINENLKSNEIEIKDQIVEEDSFSLFKKPKAKRVFADTENKAQVKTEANKPVTVLSFPSATKTTQLISKASRDWLNLPKRRFANEEESGFTYPKAVSKPLPSDTDIPVSSPDEPLKKANVSILSSIFKGIVESAKSNDVESATTIVSKEVFNWSEEKQSFEQKIDGTRKIALKEWEDMRQPDEWDMLVDQGKGKKIRLNKVANQRMRKKNVFQDHVEKKKKNKSFCCVCY